MLSPAIGGAAPATDAGAAKPLDPRLKPAAHEFEACLMKEFLKPLEHDALFDDGTDGNDIDGSSGALMSFGTEALATAISERGGFGIADKILASFGKQTGTAPEKNSAAPALRRER